MNSNSDYILRTFDLAKLGKQFTSPNPYVGAVLVENDQIIGEGYTSKYGGNHAEVNALHSVKKHNISRVQFATLYVSLEPCSIHGKTPPCTDLIIKKKIPKIIYSALDKTENVFSKSEKILYKQNISVKTGVKNNIGNEIVRIRNTFTTKKRPYIILKFAQSEDGYIGIPNKPIWLTNAFSKTLVHKWRSEVDAILIGTNTALIDNPNLTNRQYFGKNPLRIALDRNGRISKDSKIFDGAAKTWIITKENHLAHPNVHYIQLDFDKQLITNLLHKLYQEKISSIIVEGGAQLLNSFIDANLWDEARVFVSKKRLGTGIKAPILPIAHQKLHHILDDKLYYYRNITE